jgi:hypothetical protein
MNLSATLHPAEIEALSDESKALRQAGQDLDRIILADSKSDGSTFETSVRIKNTLDALEGVHEEASGRILAILLNCEYGLWRLHSDIPLRNNPFLSHWVEAVQRLDKPDSQQGTRDDLSTETVSAARVLWIKTLLQENGLERWVKHKPKEVHDMLLKDGSSESFDLRPYIQMLEDEGIYEKKAHTEPVASTSDAQRDGEAHNDDRSPTQNSNQSSEDALQKEKDTILQTLQTDPNAAIFAITRLPIALPYLDFLTTLLADRVLESHAIDPAPVVTQYIQHALRSIEQAEHGDGKDAQTRYIRLLLLFIKSLIRKGLVELDVLYYEIAEITVRYVWVREVREFRTWAEDGVEMGGED